VTISRDCVVYHDSTSFTVQETVSHNDVEPF